MREATEAGERRVALGVDGEELAEMGHLRYACDLPLLGWDYESELLAACVHGVRGLDQGFDHGGVDEAAVAEVDEHGGVTGGLLERVREHGLGTEVVLAAYAHNREPGA